MKLQDPRLEALLEAYRTDRRPTEAMREQMWQRFDRSRRPRRTWVRATVAVAVAVAAMVLVWVAIRELSGPATRTRSADSGTQAPFGRELEPTQGTAVPAGGHAKSTQPRSPAEPGIEPPPSIAPTNASTPAPSRGSEAGGRAPTSAARGASTSITPVPEPPAKAPIDDLALIESAEAALRGGEPERALGLLRRHEERFPRAPTAEERQALRVLALCAAGRQVEGRGARWAFLREHPRSAYRERIEKACPAS